MRAPIAKSKPRKSTLASFPVPTAGLISNRNLATPTTAGSIPGAAMLDNWFPTPQSVILRRGMVRRATMEQTRTVRSLFSYVYGAQQQLFAATDAGIWDVTNISQAYPQVISDGQDMLGPDATRAFGWYSVDPADNLNPATNGDWVTVQFSTLGGTFLVGVNGVDEAFLYDGTDFNPLNVSFPAPMTMGTEDFIYTWVYKQRIYFIEKNSLNVWYLAIDSIAGEATLLPLGGVFSRGGNLLFGHSWSMDSGGDGGLSEQCIFATTEGEIASYQGLSPDPDQGWSKVGLYYIGKPMGKKAFIRAGGDLVIATSIGFIPLGKAIGRDYAALGGIAISNPIADEWRRAVEQRGSENWVCELWGEGSMVLVSPPAPDDLPPLVLVANSEHGAWARFTGWHPIAMETFQGRLFFGSTFGRVQEGWVGGSDEGMPYTAGMMPLFNDLGSPGQRKIAKVARVVKRSSYEAQEKVTARFDWNMTMPAPPDTNGIPIGNEWDNAIWNDFTWNATAGAVVSERWQSVGGSGYAATVVVQVTSGGNVPLDVDIVRIDYSYDVGDIVT